MHGLTPNHTILYLIYRPEPNLLVFEFKIFTDCFLRTEPSESKNESSYVVLFVLCPAFCGCKVFLVFLVNNLECQSHEKEH